MPKDNGSATKAELEKLFTDLDAHEKGEHQMGASMSYADLVKMNEVPVGLGEMQRVSAAAAQDKRIEKYLPEIAVDLLFYNGHDGKPKIDINNDNEISKR